LLFWHIFAPGVSGGESKNSADFMIIFAVIDGFQLERFADLSQNPQKKVHFFKGFIAQLPVSGG